jgi:hypothetical protein
MNAQGNDHARRDGRRHFMRIRDIIHCAASDRIDDT